MMTRFVFLAAATALAAAGCGGEKTPSFTNVSGTITVDGKPLEKGIISCSCEGHPPSTTDIIDGRYTGQAMVGSNRVSISAKRKVERAISGKAAERIEGERKMKEQRAAAGGGGGGGPVDDPSNFGEEIIPKDYNVNTKQIRVVEAGGENKFDFIIKTK
jgi:hypothetical protein